MPENTRKPRGASTRPKRTAPKKAKRGILQDIGDFSGRVLDNVLPNVGDEVAGFGGGIGSLIKGGTYMDGYERQSKRFKQDQKKFSKERPVLSAAGTATGFVGGLALPAGRVLQAPTRAQKAAQGAKWGAGYAALSGAADGEGLKERATNAAVAAPVGAAVGYVAPGLVDDAIKAAPKVAKTIKEVIADESGEVSMIPSGPKKTKPVLKLSHSSPNPSLTEVDPTFVGTNRSGGERFTSAREASNAQTATGGRSYFGVRTGEPGGYREEQPDAFRYEAEVDPSRYLYTDGDSVDAPIEYDRFVEQADALLEDPQALSAMGLPSAPSRSVVTERLIKDAGFDGIHYGPAWNAKYGSKMGEVVHHWGEPVPVSRVEQPIAGAPTKLGPFDHLRSVTQRYADENGINYTAPQAYQQTDEGFHTRVADAFGDMEHNPQDPEVAEAYAALKDETLAQLKALEDAGYQFSFLDPANDPYPSPYDAIRDLRDNKRMQVYPTDDGFGSSDMDVSGNPLLEVVPGVQWDGRPVTYNDAFRAVHDAMGHAKEGFGFRAAGENNAYLQHLPTFSPAAQRALATETLGQNSTVNYGPNGEFNRTASAGDTIYADQKNGLLPDELIYEQTGSFMPEPRSTSYGMRQEPHGRGKARTFNAEGLQARLAEIDATEPAKSIGAPAILKESLPTQPDFGYPVYATKLKNQPSYDELGIEYEQTMPLAERKIVNPEDLQGMQIIGGMSDLTRAGGILKGLKGEKLNEPIHLEGGQDFPRVQAAQGTNAIWASDKGAVSNIMNKARQFEGDSIYMPFTMQGSGNDFSMHQARVVVDQMMSAPKAARSEFDDELSALYPDFVGTKGVLFDANREALLNQLRDNRGGIRTELMKRLDKARWQKEGMPDIGAIRQAVSDPVLMSKPTESFGNSVMKIDAEAGPITNPQLPHETYNTQLPGEYLGGLESIVPPNLMFPDSFERFASSKNGRAGVARNLQIGYPTQVVDQKFLDQLMPYMEWARSEGDLNW